MTIPRPVTPADDGPDPRSTGRLANDSWESLLTAHAVIMRQLATADIWDAVSMRDYDVLYTLAKCGQPIRQQELTKHVLLSQPAISRLLDRLVERGLVRREVDPADRRAVLLSLTEQGRAAQRRVGSRHALDVARLLSGGLTAGEMRQLERLTRKLAQPAR